MKEDTVFEIIFLLMFAFGIMIFILFFSEMRKIGNYEKPAVVIDVDSELETEFWGDG